MSKKKFNHRQALLGLFSFIGALIVVFSVVSLLIIIGCYQPYLLGIIIFLLPFICVYIHGGYNVNIR